MPFVGHGSVRPFASTPMLAVLLESARARDDGLVRGIARHARRMHPSRAYLLASHLLHRHFEREAALLQAHQGEGTGGGRGGRPAELRPAARDKGHLREGREFADRATAMTKGFPLLAAAGAALIEELNGMQADTWSASQAPMR